LHFFEKKIKIWELFSPQIDYTRITHQKQLPDADRKTTKRGFLINQILLL